MALDRFRLALLNWEDGRSSQEARRARLKRQRTQAVVLLVSFAVLGALRYRGTDLNTAESRIAWAVFVGLFLFVLAGRIYYLNRGLSELGVQDSTAP